MNIKTLIIDVKNVIFHLWLTYPVHIWSSSFWYCSYLLFCFIDFWFTYIKVLILLKRKQIEMVRLVLLMIRKIYHKDSYIKNFATTHSYGWSFCDSLKSTVDINVFLFEFDELYIVECCIIKYDAILFLMTLMMYLSDKKSCFQNRNNAFFITFLLFLL